MNADFERQRVKRSGWISGAIVVQLLLGALFLGISVFLLFLIRAPETRQGKDPASAVWGLKVAVGTISPLALLVLIGAYGMWKDRVWGWWLAFLTDMGLLGIFVYSMIDDGWDNLDMEMVTVTALSVVPVVLLLTPAVRKFYWSRAGSQSPVTAVEGPRA